MEQLENGQAQQNARQREEIHRRGGDSVQSRENPRVETDEDE